MGIEGLTHSGRCYAPGPSGIKEREEGIEQSDVEVTILKKKGKKPLNEPVSKAEANEFFKFIKHSTYSIVEQLHKLPATISLLPLMLNSEPHREAMLKVLKQACVQHNASTNKIDRLVGNIMMDNYISFSDDEIPPNGHSSTKALHITTKVKGYTLPKVLIDNGSFLNVMTLSTLMRLPVDKSYMKHTKTVVRAFDGTRREVTREIEIEVQIGPCTFNVEFQIMDISSSYNCLLGRSWIHIARAVPSTLHQKIKFVIEGQLVCVSAKEDMIVATSSRAPYVKTDEKAMECSFRSLEFVNAMYVGEGAKIPVPKLSEVTHSGIRQVLDKGARVEKGLGKRLQGMLRPIAVIQKKDRFGLGYKPDKQGI